MGRKYLESLPQDIPAREEVRSSHFWKAVRPEVIGGLLLTVLVCGVRILATGAGETYAAVMEIKMALAYGLTVASLVQWLGPVSGGHINPIISVSLLVTHSISPLRASFYCISQCLGGIVGAAILYGLIPFPHKGSLGATGLHPDISLTQAFGIEFMASLLVVLAVLSNLDPKRKDAGSRSISIGCAYSVATLFSVAWTGGNMNPACSLGPALIML